MIFMKKNILKIINIIMYILAIILLILIWTVGTKNVSLQPVLTIFVKAYSFLAIIIVAINLLKYFHKK